MKLFLGILILVGLAVVATSSTFLKLRRAPFIGMLVTGGWLAVLMGLAVGPGGLSLLSPGEVERASPLLTIGLSWIGMMIGLQWRMDILAHLPWRIHRLAAVDAAGSLLLLSGASAFALQYWLIEINRAAMIVPTALLACAGIGWTIETRSLRLAQSSDAEAALAIRGGGSLGAPVAIVIFSLAAASVTGIDARNLTFRIDSPFIRLAGIALAAVAMGIIARFGLRRAEGARAELLTIFIGVVAMIAGVASELQFSPLLAAMILGAVIANLAGRELRHFERFILQAEHTVATLIWVMAGVLLDLRIGLVGLQIAVGLALLRTLVKPMLVALGWRAKNSAAQLGERPPHAASDSGVRPHTARRALPPRQLLRCASIRQNPIAITLGVALVLADPSPLNHRLLTVIIITGLLSEVLAAFMAARVRSRTVSNHAGLEGTAHHPDSGAATSQKGDAGSEGANPSGDVGHDAYPTSSAERERTP